MRSLVMILCVLALTPTPGAAQPAPPNTTPVARQWFDAGVAASQKRQWSAAADAFAKSYELAPRPVTLFNLAGAQANIDRLVDAGENYRRFLRETSDGRYAEFRDIAQKALIDLERRTPHVKFSVIGLAADDQITLDDVPIHRSVLNTRMPLDPGNHVLGVRRNNIVLRTRSFAISDSASEDISLTVPIKEIVSSEPVITRVASTPDAPERRPTKSEPGKSIVRSGVFWGVVSAVVIGGAIGASYYAGVFDRPADPYAGNIGRGQLDVR